ncbi:unnamed protein product [Victoria cruziana]
MPSLPLLSFFLLLCKSVLPSEGIEMILVNNCVEDVWPGILGGAGHPSPENGGFHMGSGQQTSVNVPQGWSGRIWGRQGCCFDGSGRGACETGDCSGLLQCRGTGGAPPATLLEMTFGTDKSPLHYYDVSLVDGFNMPVSMSPIGGGCGVAGCQADLNSCCPSTFAVRRGSRVVGCQSACLALKAPKYCCTGSYSSPKSCRPTLFSNLFKAICPHAYSYAFDDATSLFTCQATRYIITFCPQAG